MLKELFVYLFEKVSITIIPSPRHRVRVISFRRIVPVVFLMAIIITIVTLSILYNHYEESYFITLSKLEELRNVRAENEQLKKELYALNQDTEELKENLSRLQEYNQEIKQMIDLEEDNQASNNIKLELQTFFSYNQNIMQGGLPVGGGELQLFYQDLEEVIKRTRETISMLREEIPNQEETLSSLETSVKRYNDLKAATPSIWPLADNGKAYISSEFGWRTDPFSGKQAFHDGLDIGVWYNTPVVATADGTVKFAGWKSGYGYLVIIEHGFGFETRYGHLNKIKVKVGESVKRGQTIALSGNSGKSTGPHLHYEVRKNNIPQNPRKYIGG